MCGLSLNGSSAHQKAYALGYIHCDISDGNVLIYPFDVWNEAMQQWTVKRHALLADWELAARIDDGGGDLRQPNRAVSYVIAIFYKARSSPLSRLLRVPGNSNPSMHSHICAEILL